MAVRNLSVTIVPLQVDPKFVSKLTKTEDIVVGITLVSVGVVSVIGNGASVLMFCRRFKSLTPAEVLLLNVSVVHLLLAGLSYPAAMASSFVHHWMFGDIGCQMYGFVCYFIGLATIGSLTALAVVRFFKTCTRTYAAKINMSKTRVILLFIYLSSLLWSTLPLLGIGRYGVEPFGTSCTLEWTNRSISSRVYVALSIILVVLVPITVMAVCYTKIVLLVRRNQKRRSKYGRHLRGWKKDSSSNYQLSLVSIFVCLGFMGAWMPYACVASLVCLGLRVPIYASLTSVLLAKSSCAYSPIIYIFINSRYRDELLRILVDYLLKCGIQPRRMQAMTAVNPGRAEDEDKKRSLTTDGYSIVADSENRSRTSSFISSSHLKIDEEEKQEEGEEEEEERKKTTGLYVIETKTREEENHNDVKEMENLGLALKGNLWKENGEEEEEDRVRKELKITQGKTLSQGTALEDQESTGTEIHTLSTFPANDVPPPPLVPNDPEETRRLAPLPSVSSDPHKNDPLDRHATSSLKNNNQENEAVQQMSRRLTEPEEEEEEQEEVPSNEEGLIKSSPSSCFPSSSSPGSSSPPAGVRTDEVQPQFQAYPVTFTHVRSLGPSRLRPLLHHQTSESSPAATSSSSPSAPVDNEVNGFPLGSQSSVTLLDDFPILTRPNEVLVLRPREPYENKWV